jgi:transcriptional regulator with XRE-family HTH domain
VAKTVSPLLPPTRELLRRFGDRLRLARLRRRLTAKQVAERAGMVPMTLRSLERGGPGVTIGAYLAVMQVLGIEQDLEQLAAIDPVGRQLQDARLPQHGRAATSPRGVTPMAKPASSPKGQAPKPAEPAAGWVQQGGFASAQALAELIRPVHGKRQKKR